MTPAARSRRKLRRLALLGSVRADEVLSAEVLRRRLNWGRKTYDQARADGLTVLRYGRSDYVLGSEVLRFFGQRVVVNRPALADQEGTEQ